MILDHISNRNYYERNGVWKEAFDFIACLSENTPDGKYEVRGDDIRASVSSYNTKDPVSANLEAHRVYADIQLVLVGRERLEYIRNSDLRIVEPYDSKRDIAFFERVIPGNTSLVLLPGLFAVFFPTDAHMPGLFFDASAEPVKKAVVKIRADLL